MSTSYFIPIVDSDEQPKLTEVQKGQLVRDAVQEWNIWTDMIQDLRDRSVEARQLYTENRPDQLHYDTPDEAAQSLSRVRRPVLAQAVDSVIAQQHLASYPADERFFKGKPKNQEAADNITSYERMCEKRLSDIEFMINSLKDRKNLMLDGTSCVWHPFIRKTQMKTEYKPLILLGMKWPGKPRKVKKEKVTLEATGFVPLNFQDWRIDPLADCFDEANFVWRRWVELDDMKDVDAFENTDDIASYSDTRAHDTSGSQKDEAYQDFGINPTFTDVLPQADTMALLYERWGDFYIDGECYENHVLIFSNDCNFHYFGPNPYDHQKKPFTVSPYIEMPGTLYGKSMAQDIIPLCHALDTLLNQAIDIIGRTGNPAFTGLVTDKALLEFFDDGPRSVMPGEIIWVQNHDSLKPVVWDISSIQIVETTMQRLKEEIRESTGGVPYATGGVSALDQERTATETTILAQGTGSRNQLLIQNYEETRLKAFMYMTFENDRQFMTAEVFIEDENKSLAPNEIKMMDLGFDITGSKSIMNRQREIQDYDGFLQNYVPGLIKNGLATTNGDQIVFNIPELMKRRLNMSAVRDIENVMEVKTVEEQQAEAPPPQAAPPNLGAIPLNGLPGLQPALPGRQATDLAAA